MNGTVKITVTSDHDDGIYILILEKVGGPQRDTTNYKTAETLLIAAEGAHTMAELLGFRVERVYDGVAQ